MITLTIFQWYRILRQHRGFTVFQAARNALWLASKQSGSAASLPCSKEASQALLSSLTLLFRLLLVL
jgi:hypothetical protein